MSMHQRVIDLSAEGTALKLIQLNRFGRPFPEIFEVTRHISCCAKSDQGSSTCCGCLHKHNFLKVQQEVLYLARQSQTRARLSRAYSRLTANCWPGATSYLSLPAALPSLYLLRVALASLVCAPCTCTCQGPRHRTLIRVVDRLQPAIVV